jgi:hypothetical protein
MPGVEHEAGAAVPAFLAKAPDANELRAREREMHEAQMREEARQREEQARREAMQEAPAQRGAVQEAPAQREAVRAEPAPVPAQTPEPVRVDTREMLESAGLQMVETRPDRVPAAQPEAGGMPLGRPRRERPRPAAEEQLVQVETKQ